MFNFEIDLFNDVKWTILHLLFDTKKNIKQNDDSIIHIATENGHLPIVQYLIEKQNMDKIIKGWDDYTPLNC